MYPFLIPFLTVLPTFKDGCALKEIDSCRKWRNNYQIKMKKFAIATALYIFVLIIGGIRQWLTFIVLVPFIIAFHFKRSR